MNALNVLTNHEISSNAKVLYIYLMEMAEGENNISILDYKITRDLNITQHRLDKLVDELETTEIIEKEELKYYNNYTL